MMDILSSLYPWTKALHIMSVIAWMAGLFYLPRLYVHHAERAKVGSEMSETFKMMELKLLRVIMNPAMIAAWIFGLCLAMTPGVVDFSTDGWFHVKLTALLVMTGFHMWLAKRRREFAEDRNIYAGRTYRLINEVPTILMIIIVIMVVVKPF